MNFETVQKIDFEVFSEQGVTPDMANVLLELFKKKLLSLRYQDKFPNEGISGRVIDVDEFSWQQVTPNLLSCKYSICKWNCFDDTPNAVENFNNRTRNRLAQIISDIKMEIGKIGLKVNKISFF